ncbi:MAG: bifunctional diaminohydroxyphosphoribosylaminopyrimidine deaminase/5-amino-6-(5-phosphoribosylamino)uracil reductase RibD [Gammaproteobacteria bacterium]|nr:MAG: bifunctional diaminohydroxyphosphoribosylaminopyrimidine deaminase/5-amino-6-(5-phosphoribosylamino)uracil reductase RibD [Gammaproteobacteria bacterium]
MARAIRLAERGRYSTRPNPRVGCVLVRDGEIVGEDWHRVAGGPHAEVLALRQAGDRARGATAYVTLEPCAHHGKTPPCADALIEAGVARVVAADIDPNPQVGGKGLARLEAAGIETAHGLMAAQAAALNPGFLKRMREGRPLVRVKLASSLDARTAMESGESSWITGEAARRDVQRWRARAEAVLTGIGTVLSDDPRLNVRLDADALGSADPVPQPLRVVVDTWLQMPATAQMLSLDGPTLVLTTLDDPVRREALEAAGAEVALVGSEAGHASLQEVLRVLAEREVNELHVESGPTLAGALLNAGLVDELLVYQAPHLMGSSARPLLQLPGIERMTQRIPLEIVEHRRVGEDLRILARPRVEAGRGGH